jgi:hypothetical protein
MALEAEERQVVITREASRRLGAIIRPQVGPAAHEDHGAARLMRALKEAGRLKAQVAEPHEAAARPLEKASSEERVIDAEGEIVAGANVSQHAGRWVRRREHLCGVAHPRIAKARTGGARALTFGRGPRA